MSLAGAQDSSTVSVPLSSFPHRRESSDYSAQSSRVLVNRSRMPGRGNPRAWLQSSAYLQARAVAAAIPHPCRPKGGQAGTMSKLLEALDRFDALFRRAATCDLNEPSAVTVATVDADGRPSARVVLLKGHDASGFVFYTNTLSRKGRELAANPRVAMCLFWDPLMEQVRIEGHVSTVSDAEADTYWAGRHPGSQVGAWASDQSEPLRSREALEARVAELVERFGDEPVPALPTGRATGWFRTASSSGARSRTACTSAPATRSRTASGACRCSTRERPRRWCGAGATRAASSAWRWHGIGAIRAVRLAPCRARCGMARHRCDSRPCRARGGGTASRRLAPCRTRCGGTASVRLAPCRARCGGTASVRFARRRAPERGAAFRRCPPPCEPA